MPLNTRSIHYIPWHGYIARFSRYVLRTTLFNITPLFIAYIHTKWTMTPLQDKIPLEHTLIEKAAVTNRGWSSLCGVVTAVCACTGWCVAWSFNLYVEVRANSTWNARWTYQTSCWKLPDDEPLVPKHVGTGTWHEVFCDIFYCILISAVC